MFDGDELLHDAYPPRRIAGAADTSDDGDRVGAGALADRPALTCTVCIGFAAFHGDAHELMSRADAALYRAKAEGRNRVCVAD